jgi:hypothetical protein
VNGGGKEPIAIRHQLTYSAVCYYAISHGEVFAKGCHAEWGMLCVVMLSVVMLSIVMLSFAMLNVFILSVVMMFAVMAKVAAPSQTRNVVPQQVSGSPDVLVAQGDEGEVPVVQRQRQPHSHDGTGKDVSFVGKGTFVGQL